MTGRSGGSRILSIHCGGYLRADLAEHVKSPADLCAYIRNYLEKNGHAGALEHIEIITDHHWIFLHNRTFTQGGSVYRRRTGKYKYDAIHNSDLLLSVCSLAPLVADNLLPVVKFTNIANVQSGEKLIVAYCVKGIAEPHAVKKLMQRELGERVYWGSDFFEQK
jgi:hypothetical protein